MKNPDLEKIFNEKSFPHGQENINFSDSDKAKIAKIEKSFHEKQEMLITGKKFPSQERIEEIKQEILRKQNSATLSMEPIKRIGNITPAILHSRAYQQALHEEITKLSIQRDKEIQAITGQKSEKSQEKDIPESFNRSSFSTAHNRSTIQPDRERDDDGRDR